MCVCIAMLSLTTNEHLEKIALDELGIYYVSDISMNHAYHDAVNYQIRNRSSLGHFGYEVSFISSTSPGIQPYPEGVFTYTWRERERKREREHVYFCRSRMPRGKISHYQIDQKYRAQHVHCLAHVS